jgi:regulator of protease activity HflC (stomatin/prohibitin superfamily)
MRQVREMEKSGASGWLFLVLGLGGMLASVGLAVLAGRAGTPELAAVAALTFPASILVLSGLVTVNPNEAVVVQLFGEYVGSLKTDGFRWVNPFTTKRRVSVRVTSFEVPRIKVNDRDGTPIETAAIVVFRVRDTAQAVFQVDDFAGYVRTQAEAALRNLASRHPYDAEDDALSLRRNTSEMAEALKTELQGHVEEIGIDVVDAKISHLAYAQEIAHAMLQRQQAAAVIAARTRIVEGAVTMVQLALKHLAEHGIVDLDEERKAQMVSNLLVVLCSERSTQPVVNTGTLYS